MNWVAVGLKMHRCTQLSPSADRNTAPVFRFRNGGGVWGTRQNKQRQVTSTKTRGRGVWIFPSFSLCLIVAIGFHMDIAVSLHTTATDVSSTQCWLVAGMSRVQTWLVSCQPTNQSNPVCSSQPTNQPPKN